jgi:putative transposase
MAKRNAVGWLLERQVSLRRACRVVALSTATWRYQCGGLADNALLLARLQVHAVERPRFGYRRLHTLVAREGIVVDLPPLNRPA